MAHQCCPLCRRQWPTSSAGHTLDTRLCEQCQTIVLAAFRGADPIYAASADGVPQGAAVVQVHREASVLDQPQVAAPTFFEDIATVAPRFEQEVQHPMVPEQEVQHPTASEPRADLRFEFIEDEDPAVTIGADLSDVSENGSSHHRASPADPWEDPLPAWDYSHSEWPVLVGPNKRKSFKRHVGPIAAIVLFACAAGFYLLINRPSGAERRTATDSGRPVQASAVELGATVGGAADSDTRKRVAATLSEAPASPASQPAETVAREPVTPKESTNAQGRFSLQAAAFPTQVGADEFAEKLKRTGLPSYVVPAELVRRGRWFRVGVGRFNAQEEAQRFAGEAQQRARGAGLAVQLIVCQYDQP